MNRIADDDRHDVAAMINDRQAQTLEPEFQRFGLFLMLFAQFGRGFQKGDDAAAPAATAGGSDVVKIKPGA